MRRPRQDYHGSNVVCHLLDDTDVQQCLIVHWCRSPSLPDGRKDEEWSVEDHGSSS